MYVTTQHALKGQKLLAQGNALGYYVRKLSGRSNRTGRIVFCSS